MSRESQPEREYVSCPAPACNRKGRRSAIRAHLADSDDQRHELYDGEEV